MANPDPGMLPREIEGLSPADVALTCGLFVYTIDPAPMILGGSPCRRSDLEPPPSLLSRGQSRRLFAIDTAAVELLGRPGAGSEA